MGKKKELENENLNEEVMEEGKKSKKDKAVFYKFFNNS